MTVSPLLQISSQMPVRSRARSLLSNHAVRSLTFLTIVNHRFLRRSQTRSKTVIWARVRLPYRSDVSRVALVAVSAAFSPRRLWELLPIRISVGTDVPTPPQTVPLSWVIGSIDSVFD